MAEVDQYWVHCLKIVCNKGLPSVPKEQQSSFSAAAHITSVVFSITSKARFTMHWSQVHKPITNHLGNHCKAPDYISHDVLSDTGFINWVNMSSNVSKCLFPRLTIGSQRTAPLPSNPTLSFNTSCHWKLEKYECSEKRITYTKCWSYDEEQHIKWELKAFGWERVL